MQYDREDMREALRVLRDGGVILYPTDTVWGIGCDATNEAAVRRIFEIKQRADSKAMLMLLDGPGKLQGYVDVPEAADMLLDAMDLPAEEAAALRPMTIIYPNARKIAPSLIAEDGSVGIRLTREPFTHALCEQLHHPLVSTSANISGEATPKNFKQISEAIIKAVDYVCRYRRTDTSEHKPSTIIKVGQDNTIQIIRQ